MTIAAAKAENAELSVTLKRLFDAPREAVFRAWTEQAQVAKWFGLRDVRLEITEFDARVGGKYRFICRHADGRAPVVRGSYREVTPYDRIAFTWAWEQPNPPGGVGQETLVTVTFKSVGQRTEVTLHHGDFSDADFRHAHEQGWTVAFERFGEALAV